MTRNELIIAVLVIGALVAMLLAFSSRGPRVTQIDRTVRRKKDDA